MCCHVREGAVAIVPIELILTEVGDVQVYIAVVIVITDCGTDPVCSTPDPYLVGNIGEGVIAIVAVEDVMWCLVLPVFCLYRTVDEVDVEIAIAIVIEKPTTGSEEFIEESHTASAVGMQKRYTCRLCNIDENRF